MEQCGKVIKTDGEYAVVEVKRSTACETCSAAHACPSAKKEAKVRALNTAGAKEGDRVRLETPGKSVLLYAFCVFVLPIVVAAAAFIIAGRFMSEKNALIAAACGFAAVFAADFFTLERGAKKRGGVVSITQILEERAEKDAEGE